MVNGVDHRWSSVPFFKDYDDPVVVAKPVSSQGGDSGVIRLRPVGDDRGVQVRFQEWDYLDGIHVAEGIMYLVAETGTDNLGGLEVEAGRLGSGALARKNQWDAVSFGGPFADLPGVFAAVQTANGADAVITRIRGRTRQGFQIALDEQESKLDGHVAETLGWIAIDRGAGQTGDGRHLDSRFVRAGSVATNV